MIVKITKKDDATTISWEYKDSLSKMHTDAHANMEKIATILVASLGAPPPKIPERCNAGRQASDECGFWVCHWIEDEIRRSQGEGQMAMGRPNLGKMLDRLMTTISSIRKISPAWIASHEDQMQKEAERSSRKISDRKDGRNYSQREKLHRTDW